MEIVFVLHTKFYFIIMILLPPYFNSGLINKILVSLLKPALLLMHWFTSILTFVKKLILKYFSQTLPDFFF